MRLNQCIQVFIALTSLTATESQVVKSAKETKTEKHSKSPKETKHKKSKTHKKAKTGKTNNCKLPKLESKAEGKPYWAQTGQVMTIFDDATIPRKTYTDEEPIIANNDQYIVECGEKGYVPNEMCFYTCTDGLLDETTYCQAKPEEICSKLKETTWAKQCPLDFDSDEPFYDGKSLKTWWGEVLDKYHFKSEEIFSLESDIPLYLGHGSAILEGFGWTIQHFPAAPAAVKDFNADAVEITGWVDEDYKYGPDTLTNSTTLPTNGYIQDLETEIISTPPYHLPKVTGPVPNFNPKLKAIALLRNNYDPCDNSKYLGFPPECFIYHPGGHHTGDGKMIMHRSPLNNGNIDLQGICNTYETNPGFLIPALFSNMANIEDTLEKHGGLTAPHPASRSMHLCIDDDIYHPYVCSVHPNLPSIDGDYVSADIAPFIGMPTKMYEKLCADRIAGGPDLCGATTDINYPFPWTQYL